MLVSREHGYTLIELIITLSISLIVGSLVYVIYLDALKLFHRWQARTALENQGHLVINRLTLDLYEGMKPETPADSLWIIRKSDNIRVTYELQGHNLYRDRRPMLDSITHLSRFEIVLRNNASSNANLQEMTAVRLTVRTESDSLELAAKLFLRAPNRWNPLPDRSIP